MQTVWAPAITTLLYFNFTIALGRGAHRDGVPFANFIAPGLDRDGDDPARLRQFELSPLVGRSRAISSIMLLYTYFVQRLARFLLS